MAPTVKSGFFSFSNQFFVGAGENLDENGVETVDPDAATFDLALLSSCNHTIITRDNVMTTFYGRNEALSPIKQLGCQ
jgi:hypothetical protein